MNRATVDVVWHRGSLRVTAAAAWHLARVSLFLNISAVVAGHIGDSSFPFVPIVRIITNLTVIIDHQFANRFVYSSLIETTSYIVLHNEGPTFR